MFVLYSQIIMSDLWINVMYSDFTTLKSSYFVYYRKSMHHKPLEIKIKRDSCELIFNLYPYIL